MHLNFILFFFKTFSVYRCRWSTKFNRVLMFSLNFYIYIYRAFRGYLSNSNRINHVVINMRTPELIESEKLMLLRINISDIATHYRQSTILYSFTWKAKVKITKMGGLNLIFLTTSICLTGFCKYCPLWMLAIR